MFQGCLGGAKVLSKLSVPGRPTYLDNGRTRAIVLAVGVGGGRLDNFFSRLSLLFSFSPSGRRLDTE